MVHIFLSKIFSIFTKRAREPNFCEPSSHIFSVNFVLWFTFFQSSQISGEPVNHGSQITPAPKKRFEKFNNKVTQISTRCYE